MKLCPLAAAALMLSACATKPPPPPLLAITARDCRATPDLTGAIALSLKEKDADPVQETFDETTPCFSPAPGIGSLYRVFALPDVPDPLVVSIRSTPFGQGVFAPHVTVLDAKGAPLREISHQQFMFRGETLSVLFRSHPGDRYLLIASDPTALGHGISRIEERTQSYMAAAGNAYFSVHTGSDATQHLVFTANGQVTIAIRRLVTSPPQAVQG